MRKYGIVAKANAAGIVKKAAISTARFNETFAPLSSPERNRPSQRG